MLGGEVYYDKIDKTITQSDRKYYTRRIGYIEAKNAGKPIYTTNFLLGIRGKIGCEFFKRVSLYGLVGLNYWDRNFNIKLDDGGFDIIEILDFLNIAPSYGFGVGINLTKNFELSFNYIKILDTKIYLNDTNGYNTFKNDTLKISISVITFGLKYKF